MTSLPNIRISCTLTSTFPRWANGNPDITIMPEAIKVDAYVRTILEGINTENLQLREEETAGVFEGDFVHQFSQDTGHHPCQTAQPYGTFSDMVGVSLDRSKPYQNGSAKWVIPLVLTRENSFSAATETQIVQEYTLENYKLTMYKAGAKLFEGVLPHQTTMQPQENKSQPPELAKK